MSKRELGSGRFFLSKNNFMNFSLKLLEDREEDEDFLIFMIGEFDKKVLENRRVNEENKVFGRAVEGRVLFRS